MAYDNKKYCETVLKKYGQEYALLSEYKSSTVKIIVRHEVCGEVFEVKPTMLLRGDACKKCRRNNKNKEITMKLDKYIKDSTLGKYKLIGEYYGSTSKISILHDECGNVYNTTKCAFERGDRCPNCNGTSKKDISEVRLEIKNILGEEYYIIGEYNGSKSKITLKHLPCNHIYCTYMKNIKSGNKCPKCAGQIITTSEFAERVVEYTCNNFELASEYVNSKTKVKIKCKSCGDVVEILPQNIKNKSTCACCNDILSKKNNMFIEKIKILYGDEYTALQEYKGSTEKILFKHICGCEFMTTPTSILNKKQCPNCYSRNRNTFRFKNEVQELAGYEYTVLGEYKTNHTKILMRHNKCGNEYKVQPSNFLSGRRCPRCKTSVGERKIKEYLNNNKIEFEEQKIFKECKNKKALPFDFYLPECNTCIEFDGKQHYKSSSGWGGEEKLKLNKKRDSIKDKYCNDNCIKLIRIPYWDEDNITTILNTELCCNRIFTKTNTTSNN